MGYFALIRFILEAKYDDNTLCENEQDETLKCNTNFHAHAD